MRGSVMGSGVAHLVLLVALFAVRHPMRIVVPGPDVVQVALVDPAAAMVPAPPPPAEVPEAKPAEVKPEEDTGVKLKPEPPKKKKERTEETPRKAETRAPTLPAERVGPAGLSADVAVGAGDFEFTYYLVAIRNRISGNWSAPAGISTGGNPVRTEVYFEVGRSGEVTSLRIERSSGVEFFDRSALRAVTLSDPLPPLPLGFAGGKLGIIYGFTWEAP